MARAMVATVTSVPLRRQSLCFIDLALAMAPAFHYSLQPECSTRRVKAQFARDPTGRLAADWPEDRRPLRGRGVVYTAVFLTSWPYCRYRSAVARVAGPWGGPGGRKDEGSGG